MRCIGLVSRSSPRTIAPAFGKLETISPSEHTVRNENITVAIHE